MTVALLNQKLHRAHELVAEIDSSNNITVHHAGRTFCFGPDALAILDVFSGGCTITEALQLMAPRLPGRLAIQDWLSCVVQMSEAGVLQRDGKVGFSDLSFPRGGYDASYVHIRMLNDTLRKQAFLQAIQETVCPDDIVLDLGTGSGILAVAAAQAGARHVYAVEPSGIIGIAQRVAEMNGVADRITFIRGWLGKVHLPEKATLLITDIIGNEALEMHIWEALADARIRLLAPKARMIPSELTIEVCGANAPDELLRQYRPDARHVSDWHTAYGIDFSSFITPPVQRRVGFYIEPSNAREWQYLTAPVSTRTVDLSTPPCEFDAGGVLIANQQGTITSLVTFFSARLSPAVTFSTAPWFGNEASHWYCACTALPKPFPVVSGDQLPFRYSYRGHGRSVLEPLTGTT